MPEITQGVLQWLTMGGYAAFVWPAYAVAGTVLSGLAWQTGRAHRVSERTLDRLQLRFDLGRLRRPAGNAGGRSR